MANETQADRDARSKAILKRNLDNYVKDFWMLTNNYLMEDSPLTVAEKTKIKKMRAKAISEADKAESMTIEDLEKWNNKMQRESVRMSQKIMKSIPVEAMDDFEIPEQAQPEKEV